MFFYMQFIIYDKRKSVYYHLCFAIHLQIKNIKKTILPFLQKKQMKYTH